MVLKVSTLKLNSGFATGDVPAIDAGGACEGVNSPGMNGGCRWVSERRD